jgi:hypothetical protein
MIKAQRALVEGLDPNQIIKIAEASRVASRLMGVTVEEAFNRVMEAVISLQTRGLKHVFPMDEELLLRRYAESIGTIPEYLTEAGKRQAIYNEIVRQTGERIKMVGDLAPTASEKIQALHSSFSEFKQVAGEVFLESVWSPAFNTMNTFVGWIDTTINKTELLITTTKKLFASAEAPELPSGLIPSHGVKELELLAGHALWGKVNEQVEIDYEKMKKAQLQLDLEYQGKYLQLTNDRIGQLKIEKDQAILNAKLKGLEISAIEKYYSEAQGRIVFESLNITSQKVLKEIAEHTVNAAQIIKANWKAGQASVVDYVNALKAANDAMKKLTGEDLTDQLVKNEEEYQKRIRAISPEASDEERRKQVQAAIDDYFKLRKEIEKTKIPVHADVAPMEAEVNESIRKLRAQGIKSPVTITGGESAGGGGVETLGEWKNAVTGFSSGAKGALMDLTEIENKLKGISDINIDIGIYGTGSSRKPIIEKINEIISEFGGLEKALSGMEAEINVAELSVEYKKLEAKLNQVERILPDLSNIASSSGGSPYVGGPIVQTVKDLTAEYTEQMRILQMKIDYQMLKAYGSYDTGTQYVPRTGPYILHEGEQVIPRNISSSITIINHISGVNDVKEIGNKLTQILKYRLNTELNDLLRR